MKSIIIYAPQEHFNSIIKILQENNVEGISYSDVMGLGSLKRYPSERIVQGYRTNEKYTQDFIQRIRIETVVSDPRVIEIIDAIKKENIKGKIFVYDIFESIDL